MSNKNFEVAQVNKMATIARNQLRQTYSWTSIAPDNPRVTGHPDSDLLNRHEGYEVLDFLNRYCSDLVSALKAERMIRNNLPVTIRSRANVLRWLQDNWSKHL